MPGIRPFHLAIPVHDLAAASSFYGELLACDEGRRAAHWVDFNFFGHQLVCHLNNDHSDDKRGDNGVGGSLSNAVDGDAVPVPHFGVILSMPDWEKLRDRVIAAGIEFVIEPKIRFAGDPGEQATMFFFDPSGNALEFKAFADDTRIFAS